MIHKSVLLSEAVGSLNLKPGDVFVDCTLGAGGHSGEVIRRFGNKVKIIAIDADQNAILAAKQKFSGSDSDITFVNENFRELGSILNRFGLNRINGILMDLGFSSDQLETSRRGFSFQKDEPLLMTFSDKPSEDSPTAMDIVNKYSESELAGIFLEYGEERFARRIAEEIVRTRRTSLITTTAKLVETIGRAVPKSNQHGRIHFATKVFQTLRIATNDELNTLKDALTDSLKVLVQDGRLVVISFHSLEDRIVKNFYKQMSEEGIGRIITKKPIIASPEEIEINPRARSAKMRIIEKI